MNKQEIVTVLELAQSALRYHEVEESSALDLISAALTSNFDLALTALRHADDELGALELISELSVTRTLISDARLAITEDLTGELDDEFLCEWCEDTGVVEHAPDSTVSLLANVPVGFGYREPCTCAKGKAVRS